MATYLIFLQIISASSGGMGGVLLIGRDDLKLDHWRPDLITSSLGGRLVGLWYCCGVKPPTSRPSPDIIRYLNVLFWNCNNKFAREKLWGSVCAHPYCGYGWRRPLGGVSLTISLCVYLSTTVGASVVWPDEYSNQLHLRFRSPTMTVLSVRALSRRSISCLSSSSPWFGLL